MTRRRWIADEVSGDLAALTGAHAEHLARVLRAHVGQEFDIAVGNEVRRGRVVRVDPALVEFELGELVPSEAAREIILALAIFKFDRMEWAIEKCTELGVAQIVPLIAERTDSHLAVAATRRVERWRRIARDAAEQSRRNATPEISAPVKLKDGVVLQAELRILLDESEEAVRLADTIALATGGAIALAIGPEGGWAENDRKVFRETGWVPATLGNNILRAETAAIAATAVVMSALP